LRRRLGLVSSLDELDELLAELDPGAALQVETQGGGPRAVQRHQAVGDRDTDVERARRKREAKVSEPSRR
jgi:hypothetical protein